MKSIVGMSFVLCLVALCLNGSAQAMYPYSKEAGKSYLSLPTTKKAGVLNAQLTGNPKGLNPLLVDDVPSAQLVEYLFATFLQKDRETNEFFPLLAESLDVSKDFKTMTFKIRKDATWEDGSPITADDVEFTFNTLMDKKTDAASLRSYFEGIKFEKIDQYTVKFTTEIPTINTLETLNSDFKVISKKQNENEKDINTSKYKMAPLTSGPYKVKTFSRDQKLELELKKDWWGFKVPQMKNMHSAETLVFRIISDEALAYEKFIKGDIDVLEMRAEIFGTRVKGVDKAKFGDKSGSGKNIWAKQYQTSAPSSYTYIGWNQKRALFASRETRRALAYLIDYDQINNKIYHGLFRRCVSPFGSTTPNTDPTLKTSAFNYDLKKGLAALKADGWADTDGDNVLDKMIDGKKVKFEFTVRTNSENSMRLKIAQMLKEDLKKAGISMNVQSMEFNALLGELDKRNFDAIIMGWGRGNVNADVKQIWHTKSQENQGSNTIGYSNPTVDALIAEADKELNPKKRFKIVQKISKIVYEDQPYGFLVEQAGFFSGYQDKVKAARWVMNFDDTPPIWLYSAY